MTSPSNSSDQVAAVNGTSSDAPEVVVSPPKKRPATPVVPAERVKRKQVGHSKAKAEPVETVSAHAASDAMRSVAEQSLDQVKSAFVRSQEASLSFARGMEASGQVVHSGLKEMQVRMTDALEAEAHAVFGYFRAMTQVRTLSDMIDLQSSQMRKQFERSFDEAREFSSLATAVAAKASEPVRKAFTHALDVQRPSS